MHWQDPVNIDIILSSTKSAADKIAMLIQRGFPVPVSGPLTIEELLLDLPGFNRDYIRDRVQTIFVNGLAEDDLHRRLGANDTLALSAAMPGLAGAIFRRGGRHGSLRTRPPEQSSSTARPGYITVKLFNMIAVETGPQILRAGVLIRGAVLARFLDRQGGRILPLVDSVRINDQPIAPAELGSTLGAEEMLFLTIRP